MSRLFGTDGVRGVANLYPMDSETVMKLGRAAAVVFRRGSGQHRVLIGKDTRISGYMLETALETGLASMGVDVLLVGPLPTPGVAYMTRGMNADAGIMISASHNPYEDNGIKFFGADGFKLADQTEDEIERLMNDSEVDQLRASSDKIGKMFRIDDAIGRYAVYLKNCLPKNFSLNGIKVVLDCANGATYKIAPMIFRELGAEVVAIADRPDGKNINLNCGSLHPELIAKKVKEENAFCGIAFDGDGDRVILVDETGEIVDGDLILGISALLLKKQNRLSKSAIVGTVMTNFGLERLLKENGIEFFRSNVGDRYVLAEMQERGLVLGGEQSGHVIFLDHSTTGDGLLTALMLLSLVKKEGASLSSFQKIIKRYPQLLINVGVEEKVPFESNALISKTLLEVNQQLKDKGRVLLRYSGTEMKARVMVESEDQKLCESSANKLAEVIRKELGNLS
jgi:phosphoglucosamine mutase